MSTPSLPLPDLSGFPNLASLMSEESRARYARRAAANPDYMYRVLCDADERAAPLRNDLERLIQDGCATGIADTDLLGRLKSGDSFSADSARAELEVNQVFNNLGLPIIPRPSGFKSRTGDLELSLAPPVFVEVKAVLDREFEDIEGRIWQKLVAVTDSTTGPSVVVMLQMLTPAREFRGAAYRSWLQAFLKSASPDDEGTYTDASGLVVGAKVLGDPAGDDSGPSAMPWTGARSVFNHDYYRTSLEGAYEQLPDDGRPAIIIIRSFLSFGPDDYGMERAVLGTNSVVIPREGKPHRSRQRDGFFWASRRDRASAVGLLKSRWLSNASDARAELTLDFYHNPMARNPLAWNELRGVGIRHLIATSETEMKWHE